MRRYLPAVIAASVLLAPAAAAQNLEEMCNAVRSVSVGLWVEYEISGAMAAGQSGRIRQAVVGTEVVNGTDHYWMETAMETPMGDATMQMLIPAWPFEPSDIQRMVMKMGDQPPMQMPEQAMQMMRSQMPENPATQAVEQCGDAEIIGWEDITVPAGNFRALHIRPTTQEPGTQTDVWVSQDVPFGLVKVSMTGDEGGEIVLAGHGTDATASFGPGGE